MAESKIKKFSRLVKLNVKYLYYCLYIKQKNYKKGTTCVILSRDRAFQLDALLKSIQRYSKSQFPILVQYSCSKKHENSYSIVIQKYPEVRFEKELSFRTKLIELINQIDTKTMFFLCDDQIFISDFDINELLYYKDKHNILSMRLGENITNFGIEDIEYSATYIKQGNLLFWNFRDNMKAYDWGYQFSVDGTIYSTIDVLRSTLSIPFKAPNSYESNMNSVILYKSNNKGICWCKPVTVNLLINASRTENDYLECVSGEYTTDDLLQLMEAGRIIDLDKVAAIPFNSTHHIIKDINIILS